MRFVFFLSFFLAFLAHHSLLWALLLPLPLANGRSYLCAAALAQFSPVSSILCYICEGMHPACYCMNVL